jgi:2-haloacid dehalogenase
MKMTDFKALTFDCYGTLIDWEAGMMEALRPLTEKVSRELSRDAVLEAHARHESFQQVETPTKAYRDVLAVVYRRLAEDWGTHASWNECVAYGRSIRNWPAFPDSAEALRYLKQHYRLFVLSNVDNESFSASNEKLSVTFDGVYTAEDIGSYKPSVRNFNYMFAKLKTLGIDKNEVLHTAQSLFHDHAPANALGLSSCWIDRQHDREGFGATMDPGKTPKVDFRFDSLAAFVEAHRKAARA